MPSHAALRLRTTAEAWLSFMIVGSGASSAALCFRGQQWSTGCGCISAQAFTDRFARAFEGAQVAVKLVRPVGAQFERIEFESELCGVDLFVELSGVLGFDDRV